MELGWLLRKQLKQDGFPSNGQPRSKQRNVAVSVVQVEQIVVEARCGDGNASREDLPGEGLVVRLLLLLGVRRRGVL